MPPEPKGTILLSKGLGHFSQQIWLLCISTAGTVCASLMVARCCQMVENYLPGVIFTALLVRLVLLQIASKKPAKRPL